jgi:hypothetical protein
VDKPGGGGGGQLRVEYGLSWGIFFGLLAALALVAAGLGLRAAQVAEPALPGDVAPDGGPAPTAVQRPRAPRAATPSPPGGSDDPTRARRRQQREEGRRAARATAETPVRERRRSPPDEAPTRPFGTPPSFEAPELPPPPKPAPEKEG